MYVNSIKHWKPIKTVTGGKEDEQTSKEGLRLSRLAGNQSSESSYKRYLQSVLPRTQHKQTLLNSIFSKISNQSSKVDLWSRQNSRGVTVDCCPWNWHLLKWKCYNIKLSCSYGTANYNWPHFQVLSAHLDSLFLLASENDEVAEAVRICNTNDYKMWVLRHYIVTSR